MPYKHLVYAAFYHFEVPDFANKIFFQHFIIFYFLYVLTICRRGSADFIDSLTGTLFSVPVFYCLYFLVFLSAVRQNF